MFGSLRVDHSILEERSRCCSRCSAIYIKRDNLGVGDFDLPSRAYTSETADTAASLRAQRHDRAEGRSRAARPLRVELRDAVVRRAPTRR